MGPYVIKVFGLHKVPRSSFLANSIRVKKNILDPKYFPELFCLPNLRKIRDPQARYEAQVLEEDYMKNLNEFVVVCYYLEQPINGIKALIALHEPKLEVESYFTDINTIEIALLTRSPNKRRIRDLLYEKIELFFDHICYQRTHDRSFIVSSGKPKDLPIAGITNKTFREGGFWLITLRKGDDNSMQVEFGSMRKIKIKFTDSPSKKGLGVIETLSKDSNPYFTTALLKFNEWASGLGKGRKKLPIVKNEANLFEYSLKHLRDYELKFLQKKLDERQDRVASSQQI